MTLEVEEAEDALLEAAGKGSAADGIRCDRRDEMTVPLPKPAMEEMNPYRGLGLGDDRPWLHWYDADQLRAYGDARASEAAAEFKADAERYRWLKANATKIAAVDPSLLDGEIDAAMGTK